MTAFRGPGALLGLQPSQNSSSGPPGELVYVHSCGLGPGPGVVWMGTQHLGAVTGPTLLARRRPLAARPRPRTTAPPLLGAAEASQMLLAGPAPVRPHTHGCGGNPFSAQTLENTREADDTMVAPDDDEVMADENDDEFAGACGVA